VKDTYETAGIRTTCGSKSLENYVPKQDAVVVARLKQAGAIIVGKTNVPEFASDHQSYNDVAGTTNNPWDVTRTPGGSTGGGAAALAAGLGFLEIGSDIAGSIRLPVISAVSTVTNRRSTSFHKLDTSRRHPACCRVQQCCRLQARSPETLLICCSNLA
jgi:Amidase